MLFLSGHFCILFGHEGLSRTVVLISNEHKTTDLAFTILHSVEGQYNFLLVQEMWISSRWDKNWISLSYLGVFKRNLFIKKCVLGEVTVFAESLWAYRI